MICQLPNPLSETGRLEYSGCFCFKFTIKRSNKIQRKKCLHTLFSGLFHLTNDEFQH